jgi:hypothetical protein
MDLYEIKNELSYSRRKLVTLVQVNHYQFRSNLGICRFSELNFLYLRSNSTLARYTDKCFLLIQVALSFGLGLTQPYKTGFLDIHTKLNYDYSFFFNILQSIQNLWSNKIYDALSFLHL